MQLSEGQEQRHEPLYPGVRGQRAKACRLVCMSAQNRAEIIGFLFFKKRFYLFLERQEWREKERERNIKV